MRGFGGEVVRRWHARVAAMIERRVWAWIAIVPCTVFACSGGATTPDSSDASAAADVSDAADPCTVCQKTLAAACSGDGGLDCPPDLASPGYSDWVQRQIGTDFGEGPLRAPECFSFATCPTTLTVAFGAGVDCELAFVFDATTNKLYAITQSCDGSALGTCLASDVCAPNRCLPLGSTSSMIPSAACPPMSDGGLLDAQTE